MACFTLQAQTGLPNETNIYLPHFIKSPNEKDNSEWMSLITKGKFGKNTNTYWVVYSDKDKNQTFDSPGGSPFKSLTFGQKLIIADIKNNYALVYEQDKVNQIYPKVVGESMGWVSLDNLLLWDRSPMDKNQVFKKAVVLMNLDANVKGDIAPDFLSNPITKLRSGRAANKLEFYFIMKTTRVNNELFYLLSKNWTISSSIGRENNLYGWLSVGNVSEWDNRLCFETTWDNTAVNDFKSRNIKPMVLKSENDAEQYKRKANISQESAFWVANELSNLRTNPQLVRLPLVTSEKQLKEGIYKVASIGQIGGGNGNPIDENKKAQLERELEELLRKQNNVNIIFVVDGTISMGRYFSPIANAIDKSMRSGNKGSHKFGAVVYRDYTDGPRAIEQIPLTDNYVVVSNFLNTREATQPNGLDTNFEEAVFYGLETALDRMVKEDESNFVFLIGDCGNHRIDPEGRSIEDIIPRLIENRVNMLAFQVNNANHRAYNAFILQAKQIISRTIAGVTEKAGSPGSVDVKLDSRGLYKTYRVGGAKDELTPILGAYTFCNPNERKEPQYLETLIEDMINEYSQTVEKRIRELQKITSGPGHGPGEISIAVKEELTLRGWSNSDIESLIDKEVKIAGYTSDSPGGSKNQIFVPVLFISHEEYISLVTQLNRINSANNISLYSRTAFQDALRGLGETFFGLTNVDETEISTLMAQLYGIPPKFKPSSLDGIRIIDITDHTRLPQPQLEKYIDDFRSKLPRLEKIQGDSDYQFLSNGIIYYWIPIFELP